MRTSNCDSGFTLIEVMITASIVGVLAAIALPGYMEYREDGYDAEAQAALREVATAEEAYFLDNDSYISCDQNSCPLLLEDVDNIAAGVQLQIISTGQDFTGIASHSEGTGEEYTWNSG